MNEGNKTEKTVKELQKNVVSLQNVIERLKERIIIQKQDKKVLAESLELERINLCSILDSIPENIYIQDPLSYKILFVNTHYQNVLNKEVIGSICYKELHSHDEPCIFCPNEYKSEKRDEAIQWVHYDPFLQKHYLILTTDIKWMDNKDVRLNIAFDRTELEKMREKLRFRKRVERLLGDISTYFAFSSNFLKAMDFFLSEIGELFNLDGIVIYIFNETETLSRYSWIVDSTIDRSWNIKQFPLEKIPWIMKQLQNGKEIFFHRNNDFLLKSRSEKKLIEELGVKTFFAIPIFTVEVFVGAILTFNFEYFNDLIKDELFTFRTFLDVLGSLLYRINTEEALKKSEMKYQSFIEGLPVGVYRTTLEQPGKFLQANLAMAELFGYDSVNELMNTSVDDLYSFKEDRNLVVNDLIRASSLRDKELFLQKKDGYNFWVLSTAQVKYDPNSEEGYIDGVFIDITERKKAEQELKEMMEHLTEQVAERTKDLQESKEKYQMLVEEIDEGVMLEDQEGFITFVNPKIAAILGYNEEELIGVHWSSLVAIEDLEKVRTESRKRPLGVTSIYEVNTLTKEGYRVPVLVTSSPIISEDEQFIGVVSVVTDIRERIKTKEALEYRLAFEDLITSISSNLINLTSKKIDKELNEALHALGNFAGVDRSYIFLLHKSGKIMDNTHEWCSRAIKQQFQNLKGLPSESFPWFMKKLNQFEEIHVPSISDLPAEAKAEREFLQERETQSILLIPMTYKKTLFGFLGFDSVRLKKTWPEDTVSLLTTVGEIFTNALIRKQTEEEINKRSLELLQWKNRVELLIEMVPTGLLAFDNDGRIILANKIIKDYCKDMNSEELPLHQSCFEFSDNIFLNTIKSIFIAKKTTSITIEPINDFFLRFNSVFVGDSSDQPLSVIISVTNISEFVKFDNLRKKFVSNVSHELRTPISVIVQSTNNLMKYKKKLSEEDEVQLINWIAMNARLLSTLIEDLLIISKIDDHRLKVKWQKYSPFNIIHEVISQLEVKIQAKDVKIKADIANKFFLFGDSRKISQVFRILVDNAIKYSGEKTLIKIEASYYYKGEKDNQTIDGILIKVIDQGIGVSENDIPNLFERFFRADNVKHIQGTGLGLPIAHELITLHKGYIYVESELGKGSTFSVFLPRLTEQPLEDEPLYHKSDPESAYITESNTT